MSMGSNVVGRNVLAVLGGLVTWAVIATVLNFGVRAAIPAYTAAEPLLAFTLTMKIARLALAVVSSIAAGFITRTIAPASRWAPWIVGAILLLLFLPAHIQIGARLPLWYHLFFLLTLAPLVDLGGQLRLRSLGAAPTG